MTNKISIALFVFACAFVFAVMANGYKPVQNALVYLFPVLEHTQIPYYDIYRKAGDR